ncbi:MAG: malate synthase A [Acidobacteriota bacterium]|nr:malate synthase A [Blastocatellia bacterium]MDW8411284.1 malate synthase A [Acidobacteriota bacterium]
MNESLAQLGIEIKAVIDRQNEILTPEAIAFVASLVRQFRARRDELLTRRKAVQEELFAGRKLEFPTETADIRQSDWTVAPLPDPLLDRRVEITGPVDRKMIINALNSGARVYMADFEDSNSPTWSNIINGQINLRDAVEGTISYTSPEGKLYRLNEKPAVLMVRPRGWHLVEKHFLVDGQAAPASLFDFGLFFFHNARKLTEKGLGPYLYLPKLESYLEARLWNDVFLEAQAAVGLPRGSIKATVLIETITAAFEMDEILYELREHSAGLNCGRWDYIFSFIKKFRHRPEYILPDRAQVTMTTHFLRSYSQLLIKTCHRRGVHAMGGMAAQIPIKNDPVANKIAIDKVREDKQREANDGHDGTWVAHPALVAIAMEVFDSVMKTPNQIHLLRKEFQISADDLLQAPKGEITEAGVRTNIDVGIRYLAAWLQGSGCVPIYNLMEDAATAEICRAQIWQWLHHEARLSDGRKFTANLFKTLFQEELDKLVRENVKVEPAAKLFEQLSVADNFEEFLTIPAYEYI